MSWRASAACSDHIDDWLWMEHPPSDEPIALAEARPRTPADLIKVQGLGPAKAGKYGEPVLAILAME